MKEPRSLLITGASSGIGEALAEVYARPGAALALSGRNSERLEAVAERCRGHGAAVTATVLDVADRAAMAAWIEAVDRAHPLDLVFANAGVSAHTSGVAGADTALPDEAGDEAIARRMRAINIEGVMNTVFPALAPMRARGRGQIAIMSSLAAYLPLLDKTTYGSTRGAVKQFGEALRIELGPCGIGVSVICPGFVRSRITAANTGIMPFLMDASAAAALIKRRLERDPPIIAFPWPMHLAAWTLGALPAAIRHPLLNLAARKA